MFSRLCIAAVTVLASVFSATAADLPSRSSPPPVVMPPMFTWTGFYIGASAGWAQTTNDLTAGAALPLVGAVVTLPSLQKDGGIAGLLVGYNYQIGQMVLGAELDGSAMITGKVR